VTSRIKETKKIFAEFRKAYGNKINLSNLNEVKVAQAKVSGIFDSTKPKWAQDVNYQISKVARRNIEKSLKGTPLAKLNAFIGEHYDSIRMLEKVHGNAAKGGRLGQYFGRTVGAVAGGTAGGPVGVIVGSELGNKIAKILTELSAGNPLLKKAIARITRGTPEVVSRFLEGIKKTDPKIYKELVEELGFTPTKALLKAKPGDIKKLLPAGSSKPSAFSPKKTPSKTINKKNNTFIKML